MIKLSSDQCQKCVGIHVCEIVPSISGGFCMQKQREVFINGSNFAKCKKIKTCPAALGSFCTGTGCCYYNTGNVCFWSVVIKCMRHV